LCYYDYYSEDMTMCSEKINVKWNDIEMIYSDSIDNEWLSEKRSHCVKYENIQPDINILLMKMTIINDIINQCCVKWLLIVFYYSMLLNDKWNESNISR